MIKTFLSLSLILACANAEITLQDINSKPSGRAKNFMIWQYLKQDITSKQADTAYTQVEGNIYKIKKLYLKKSTNKALKREAECKGKKDLLSISEKDCLKLAMSPYKTLNMDDSSREKLINKLESKSAKDLIRIQAEPYSQKAYQSYDSNTILSMYISTTKHHRRNNLNINLSKKFLNHMFGKDASSWKKFHLIKTILNDDKLNKLQKSILNFDGKNVGADSNFLLGLHHLKHSQNKSALVHFNLAKIKAKNKMAVDKNLFWIYQTTTDKKYLEELSLSMDINIYSLYAKEKLDKDIDNYFSSVEIINKKNKKNICDPFIYNDILSEIKNTPKDKLFELANKYKQKEMASVQSYIIERAYNYKMHGYIMPYNEYLSDISNDEKALVYALMRQESYLIPSALSRSFALGLMQIMPFVTDDLSKRMKNPITCYDDMFQPKHNIKYALKHLKWMKKSLYHPLFTAYAYNGGMGFFRKHLRTGAFTKGKYEPFLSMELMSNKESREYGKKVLSNYVMYKKILGEEVSIITLLNNLTDPKKTDRFR